jgi:signal transduction histidine kinase
MDFVMPAIFHRIRTLFQKHRFQRLHSEDSVRVEESLAVARVFIVVAALIAVYIDPTEPSRFVAVSYAFLIINLVYSLGLLVYVRSLGDVSAKLQTSIHWIDVFWASLLSFFSQGPGSVFFVFFILALVSAAYRWYFRETIVTISAILGLLVLEAFLLSQFPVFLGGSGEVELNHLIVRSTYVIGVGILVGFLGQKEKVQRAQVTAASRITSGIQAASGLNGAIRAGLGSLLDIYGAREVALAVHYWRDEQMTVWRAHLTNRALEVNESQGNASSIPVYFFDGPSSLWCATMEPKTGNFAGSCLDVGRRRFHAIDLVLPKELLFLDSVKRVFCTSVRLGEEQRSRLFIFDPPDSVSLLDTAQSLHFLAEQMGPAIYTMLLLDVLRSRAGAIERARLARELHDGVIQSLVGAEMRVEAWRRHKQNQGTAPSVEEMENLQQLLHSEVVSLRELMQQMRAAEVNPEELLDVLAVRVDRFRRDTGISARFVSDLREVSLSRDTCQEIVRIVQEALVNVRKHSEARHAVVRFERRNGQWKLTIDDDGCGFPFRGRRSLNELDQSFEGPEIVKERVRAIGGDLIIESWPGRGSHLEITLASNKND